VRTKLDTIRFLVSFCVITAAAAFAVLFVDSEDGSDGPPARPAFADTGDFSLDFTGAENTTYHQHGPDEGDEIGSSEGQNLAFDDKTINVDVVEQLEAEDFLCEDRIIFFTQITVDGDGDSDQTIFIRYDFDAVNGGQEGAGYSDVLTAGISFVDFPSPSQTKEDGNIGLDGTESVSLVSEAFDTGSFGAGADHLFAVVRVTDLDAGEELIVRVDVRFSCFDFPVTGNLHAAVNSAFLDDGDGVLDEDDDSINVGQQDVPMLGLGELPTPTPT